MPDATVIAHLSDLHMTPPTGFSPVHWNVKRTLGLINWHRGRVRVHRREVLDEIVADMRTFAPDHIAVTGDLCNIGLPSEYEAARLWLEGLGSPADVSVVPGNHDIYTRVRRHAGIEVWRPFMKADGFGAAIEAPAAVNGFPYVRRVGGVALIGVNSAVETQPFVSAGKVGEAQRARLAVLLDQLATSGLARIVMIHHPPLPQQAPPVRGISDAPALEVLLARHGAELIIHGHNHRDSLVWCEGTQRIPVVGIASATAARHHKGEPLGTYNLIRVRRSDDAWSLEIVGRGISAATGGVVEVSRKVLHV